MLTSIRNKARSEINNKISYLKKLEKEGWNKPNTRRKKEIIKIVEISETENRKTTEKSIKQKAVSLKKINTIDKILARLSKRKKTQTTNIKNEIGDITTDPTVIIKVSKRIL